MFSHIKRLRRKKKGKHDHGGCGVGVGIHDILASHASGHIHQKDCLDKTTLSI